jgi:hypothetical protein
VTFEPYTTDVLYTAMIALDCQRLVICPRLKIHPSLVEDPEMAPDFKAFDRHGGEMKMAPGLAYCGFITWANIGIEKPMVYRFTGYLSGT